MKRMASLLFIMILFSSIAHGDPLGPYRNKYIEGYLMEIAEDEVTIEEYDGTVHTLKILKDAILTIDGIPVKHSDFRRGMEVYGSLQGRSLKTLESYSTENPGYIPPGKKVRAGIVKAIEPNSITIRLPSGEEEVYLTNPATIVSRKKGPTSIARLYEGDSVRLYFDEYNTNTVSRIVVEGDSILIKGLYKATLSHVDNFGNKIVLKDVKRLNNANWTDYNDLLTLDLARNLPLYIGGYRLDINKIKHYIGREVYIAVKDFFGQATIERITIKNDRERNYTDRIVDINHYSESFTLNNLLNISFSDGTIIVKNNRLVDKYSLNPNSTAFIAAEGHLNPLASLIYIYDEDLNNSQIGQNYLFFGRLDEIIDYEVVLHDYSVLERNEWNYYRNKDIVLYYDDDTYIYDLDNKRIISTAEFQAGNYAVDEDSSYADRQDLRDWYAYVYTDGNSILAIGLTEKEDDLIIQRITAGTIKAKDTDPYIGDVIILTDGRDWSSRNESFMPKTQDMRLMIENALIIKEDRLITKDELTTGDRLYIVRNDIDTIFILVK